MAAKNSLTNRRRSLPPQRDGVYNVELDKSRIISLLNAIDERVFNGETN